MNNSINKRYIGQLGEEIACDFLRQNGYEIVTRNFVPDLPGLKKAECDIVAKKNDVFIFVEVKTLHYDKVLIEPEQKVGWQKQKQIIKAAQWWLFQQHLEPDETNWRIDVIAVSIDSQNKKAQVRHIEDITAWA